MAAPQDAFVLSDTSMPAMEQSIWTSGPAGLVGLTLLVVALAWLAGRALKGVVGKQSPWRDGR